MDYENLTPQYRIEEYLEAIVEGWAEATQYPYPDYPSWRIEEFLDAFITYIWEDGDHPRHPCPDPVWRLEECLRAIYDVMTGAATPWAFPLPPTNNIEEYLAAIHAYLADGTELPVPEPVWRIEQWLAYVLDAVKQGGGIEKTVSGTMVHITDALAKAALSVLVNIEPIQDLHGYANPWPAGGGKNKFDPSVYSAYLQSDGKYRAMVSEINLIQIPIPSTLLNTACTFSFYADMTNAGTLTNVLAQAVVGGTSQNGNRVQNGSIGRSTVTFTPTSESDYIHITFGSEGANEFTFYSIQLEAGSAVTDYSPYSNICPISGRTGLSVYVSPTQDPDDATTYAVDWTSEAGTVYGGTLDVVTGVLTVDRGIITDFSSLSATASLARDGTYMWSLPVSNVFGGASQRSISSFAQCRRDFNYGGIRFFGYTNGLIYIFLYNNDRSEVLALLDGQQIVYELATPLTYQLTAQEVQMLLGENYVWSSSGDTVSVTYYAEGNANPLQSLNILLGGNYSNPKTADDVSDKEALDIILGGNK